MQNILEEIKFDINGLVPAIAQDVHSKKVRMMAYMNKEALAETIKTGYVHYYSRTRKKLWKKGETSGHYQLVRSISLDCDGDALLIQIEQVGGVSCHTGNHTCFYRTVEEDGWKEKAPFLAKEEETAENMLNYVYDIVRDRKENPQEGSYTNYLLQKGVDKILKKLGEECTEVVIATKNQKSDELIFEIADLLFHLSVLMVESDVTWEDIYEELSKRK